MKRFAIGRKGIVANVIAAEAASDIDGEGGDVFEDVAGTVNPGDAYVLNPVDLFGDQALKVILSLQNEIRELKALPPLNDVEELKI